MTKVLSTKFIIYAELNHNASLNVKVLNFKGNLSSETKMCKVFRNRLDMT